MRLDSIMKNTNKRLFSGHYDEWRMKRINKIVSLLGEDFFKDKEVLELGCGWGDVGLYFENLGAKLTFADAREEHLSEVRKHSPEASVIQVDQDKNWNLEKKFDLIIHMGVLYHLANWKQDLRCALKHSDLMILESIVANDESDSYEYINNEPKGYDQAFNKIGCRPSAAYIEKELADMNYKFTRFDTSDMNSDVHEYDWVVNNLGDQPRRPDNRIRGYRRFWLVEK